MERGKVFTLRPVPKHCIVPFAGRLLRGAWLPCSSQSFLTGGNRGGSGRLVCGSPWLNARTGRCKRLLLGFAAFPVLCHGRWSRFDAGEGDCA